MTIEMMMPRPSVAIASVWPFSFRTGRASTHASRPVATAPAASAASGGQLKWVVRPADA